MKLLSSLVLVSLFLAGCQSSSGVAPIAGAQSDPAKQASSAGKAVGNGVSDCVQKSFVALSSGGGTFSLPRLPGSKNFGGNVKYADNSGGIVGMEVCPGADNIYNVPVPSGYTPDWFCQFVIGNLEYQFASAKLFGEMKSTGWLANADYWLFVYDSNNNLVESYQMGPLKKGKLKFASPFENGFTLAGPKMNFEIAHMSG